MLRFVFLFFVALLVSPISFAFNQPLNIGVQNDKQELTVTSRFVLSSTDTPDQAYESAIGIAKLEAAQQVGQYFEVVKLTDTESGDTKEFLASVSAANLKYEVIKKELELIDGEPVAVVTIKASYSQSDMKGSLERFMANQQIRDELLKTQREMNELEDSLKVQDETLSALRHSYALLESSSVKDGKNLESLNAEIKHLKKRLALGRSNIKRDSAAFQKSIERLNVTVETFDSSSLIAPYKSAVMEAKKGEQDYVNGLKRLILSIDNKSTMNKFVDAMTSTVTLKPFFYWSMDESALGDLFSRNPDVGFRVASTKTYKSQAQRIGMNNDSFSLIRRKYALFYVIEVMGKKYEMPIVLPTVSHTSYGMDAKHCFMAVTNNRTGNVRTLCVVNKMSHAGALRGQMIAPHTYQGQMKDFITFDASKAFEIKKYYEIREVINGRVEFSTAS